LPQLRVPPANGNSLVESLVGIGRGDLVVVMSVSPDLPLNIHPAAIRASANLL
jgi:hypothetical protein